MCENVRKLTESPITNKNLPHLALSLSDSPAITTCHAGGGQVKVKKESGMGKEPGNSILWKAGG